MILQCTEWNEKSDVWSIGCIICELITGEMLFPTYEDYEHLAMIEKNSGKFPHWMVSKIRNGWIRKLFLDGYVDR